MSDVLLSPHFWLSEFTSSQVAMRRGIYNIPNGPDVAELRRVAAALELVREACGNRPISISSGYRCSDLNKAVGGAYGSAHMLGRAADFTVPGLTPLQVCQLVAPHADEFGIDQLIYEGTWVHLGLAASGRDGRAQVLTAEFAQGGVRYTPGLPVVA